MAYTKESFLSIITQVVEDLGYFPSETEYRKYRMGKKLPMPKISKKATGFTWPQLGEKYFNYNSKRNKAPKKVSCKQCGKIFNKSQKEIKKSKNNFCSKSCSAKYNNSRRKNGQRYSKLEIWLSEKLWEKYPRLEIKYNKTDAINSELDIYIPSLSLAFELNGIFHYEPIYGKDKLIRTQKMDKKKLLKCTENNIKLYQINTSGQKKFTKESSMIFLNFIEDKIDSLYEENFNDPILSRPERYNCHKLVCNECKKHFKSNNKNIKYCSKECKSKAMKHPSRPNDEELLKMYKNYNCRELANIYKTSFSSVARWIRQAKGA